MPANPISSPAFSLRHPSVSATLDQLYAATVRVDPGVRQAAHRNGLATEAAPGFYAAMRDAYMPVTPDLGCLLYLLARSIRARRIVEYGTSFGISTIYLAAALRDNGGGRLLTTEIEPAKAQRAHHHLVQAGLDDLVEIRIGDAAQTLSSDILEAIDFVLLDGAKSAYLQVLKALEPALLSGALVVADNSDMAGTQAFLDYVSEPHNGYLAAALFTEALGTYHGHQVVLRA